MNKIIIFFITLFLLSNPAIAWEGITLSNDYIIDIKEGSNNRTFNDKMIRVDYKQAYGTWYMGDYQYGIELGGYIKDSRKSSYFASIRSRSNDNTYRISTDQVLRSGFVGKFEVSHIRVDDISPPDTKHELLVYGFGLDKYYGDYNYFTAMYFNDPREAGRFSVILSNTLGTEYSYLRLGLIPRNDGTIGYFMTIKYYWVFAGYSFTKEFDYSTRDRRVISFGILVPFDTNN